MKCSHCEKEYKPGENFCSRCGIQLRKPTDSSLPFSPPAQKADTKARDRERIIYLILMLVPWLLSSIIGFFLSRYGAHELSIYMVIVRYLIYMPALVLMIYATYRFCSFLEFETGDWVVAYILLFCCYLASLIFVLYKSAMGKKDEFRYVGRIYGDEELQMPRQMQSEQKAFVKSEGTKAHDE